MSDHGDQKDDEVNLKDLDEENEIEYMVDDSNKVNFNTSIKFTNLTNYNPNSSKILVVNPINNSAISRLTKAYISDSGSVFELEDDLRHKKKKTWREMVDSLENGYSGNKCDNQNQSKLNHLNLDGKYPSTQKRVRKKYKKSEIYEIDKKQPAITEFHLMDFLESIIN